MRKSQRRCEECPKFYWPKTPWQRFCSRRCANRYNQREYMKRLKERAGLLAVSGATKVKGLASETPEYAD